MDLGLPEQLFSLGVSRDGTLAIVDGSAIWDLRTKRPISIISTSDFGFGTDIGQFSADGSQLVTSAGLGIVQVMPTSPVRGRSAELGHLPGNVVRAVPASEGRVTIVGVEFEPDATAVGPFGMPPGTFVAALVDPAEERIVTTVPLGVGNESAVSHDGHVVAVRDQGDGVNTIQLVDGSTGKQLRRIESGGTAPPPEAGGPPGPTFSLSSDGAVLAFADERGILHLVDTATGRERATVEVAGAGPVFSAFTPDDRLVVVRGQAGGDTGGGTLGTFTSDGGVLGEPLELGDEVHVAGVAATADAILVGSDRQVVVVSYDGRSVLGPISGSLGGRTLDAGSGRVAIDGDAGLRLWDVRTRLPIGNGIGAGYGPWWRSPVIATDAGRSVLYEFASPGNTLFMTRTTLDPGEVVAELCDSAGANLTEDEWAQYFPGTRYRATCGS